MGRSPTGGRPYFAWALVIGDGVLYHQRMALSNARFFRFCVRHIERGDLAAMMVMLDDLSQHREELLNGSRDGADGGHYSAVGYGTWLCQFDAHQQTAQPIVEWLIKQGASPSIWTAIALRDEADFVRRIDEDSGFVHAKETVWGSAIVELVPKSWRHHLIERGLDISDPFTAVFLGEIERARAAVLADAKWLSANPKPDSGGLFNRAICCSQDGFASWLMDQGVFTEEPNQHGLTPLVFCCLWGCPKTARRLIEGGSDVTISPLKRSLLDFAMLPVVPSVEVLEVIVEFGGLSHEKNPKALIRKAKKQGNVALADWLREAMKDG